MVSANVGFPRQALRYFRDPRVRAWRKWVGVGALLYTAWPLDVLPDVLPFIGWLDDVGVLGAAAAWMTRDIRRHARGAETDPPVQGPR